MAHILLVIADTTLSNLLAETLFQEGHTVDQYYSYECAFKKYKLTYRQFPYSIVIVDHFLPETDGGTFTDQINGIKLIKKIINKDKIWKKEEEAQIAKNYFYFYSLSYRLCPEIIFLSSNPESLDEQEKKSSFNRLAQKEKSGKLKKYSPVTLMYKGKELFREIKFKITELEIYYWRRIFAISFTGFVIQAIIALGIVLGKYLSPITPDNLVYILFITFMQIALYISQVYPNLPNQAISRDRAGNKVNSKKEGNA